jgi:hypothetical protein
MLGGAHLVTVRPAGRGYGLRVGPFLLPWLPAAALLAVAGLAILSPVAADTWLALVGGREIVQHGLPAHDALSSLAHGRDWIDQAWLGQLAFYGAYAVGGLGAVEVAGRVATTAAGLLALATAARRRSSPLACTLALILGYILLVTRNELRPQLLAEPLFAALVWLLAADARRPSRRLPGVAALCLCGALVGAFTLTSVATGDDASLLKAYPRSASPIAAAAARDPHSSVLASPWLADWLLFKKPALAGRIVADGRFELLTSDEFARYVSALDARRPLATTFPEARILALNDSPKLAAHARRQPGARVISEEPAMVAITLPAGGSPG